VNLVPFPAHRHGESHEYSVPSSAAPRFERLLAERLRREFPNEMFSVYPDWDGYNLIVLLAPRTQPASPIPSLDGRRVLGFERQVRTIVDRLLRSDDWRGPDDLEH
jgi:hypothetical protein